MEYAIEVLRHAESVLVKKIKGMKDGKPKYAASHKVNELRNAIDLISHYESAIDELDEVNEEHLAEMFSQNPPKAKA